MDKIKLFNEIPFIRKTSHALKSKATAESKKFRKKGFYSRVVKEKNKHVVYKSRWIKPSSEEREEANDWAKSQEKTYKKYINDRIRGMTPSEKKKMLSEVKECIHDYKREILYGDKKKTDAGLELWEEFEDLSEKY